MDFPTVCLMQDVLQQELVVGCCERDYIMPHAGLEGIDDLHSGCDMVNFVDFW